jgi:hypothetical protein
MTSPSAPHEISVQMALRSWASLHGLSVAVREHWDAVSTHLLIADSAGDQYELFATLDPNVEEGAPAEQQAFAKIGASLRKRGASKHLAFHRERQRLSHTRVVPLSQVASALDEALDVVRQWSAESGNVLHVE